MAHEEIIQDNLDDIVIIYDLCFIIYYFMCIIKRYAFLININMKTSLNVKPSNDFTNIPTETHKNQEIQNAQNAQKAQKATVQSLAKLSQKIDFNSEEKIPFAPTLVAGPPMIENIERNTEKEPGYKFIEEKGGDIKDFNVVLSNPIRMPLVVQRIVGLNRKLQGTLITITPKHGNASAFVTGGSYDGDKKILIVAGSEQSREDALMQETFHAYTSQWFPVIYDTSYSKEYLVDLVGKSTIFKNLNPIDPYRGHQLEEFFSEIITLVSNPELGFSRLTDVDLVAGNPGYRLIRDFASSIKGQHYNPTSLAKVLVPFAQKFYK